MLSELTVKVLAFQDFTTRKEINEENKALKYGWLAMQYLQRIIAYSTRLEEEIFFENVVFPLHMFQLQKKSVSPIFNLKCFVTLQYSEITLHSLSY